MLTYIYIIWTELKILKRFFKTCYDRSNECETSIPFRFNAEDNRNNHFEYDIMLSIVVMNGTKMIDSLSSDQRGLKDVVIYNVDGSSDPSGQAYRRMLFSYVMDLAVCVEKSCIKYPQDISYCTDSSYQAVSFMVDQIVSEEFAYKLPDDKLTEKLLQYPSLKNMTTTLIPNPTLKIIHYFLHLCLWAQQGKISQSFTVDKACLCSSARKGILECDTYVITANIIILDPTPSLCNEVFVNGNRASSPLLVS